MAGEISCTSSRRGASWLNDAPSIPSCSVKPTSPPVAAVDLGINWIDTAPFYGWGRAEELVGKALRGKRARVYLFTKCGTLHDERGEYENLTPESIRREALMMEHFDEIVTDPAIHLQEVKQFLAE